MDSNDPETKSWQENPIFVTGSGGCGQKASEPRPESDPCHVGFAVCFNISCAHNFCHQGDNWRIYCRQTWQVVIRVADHPRHQSPHVHPHDLRFRTVGHRTVLRLQSVALQFNWMQRLDMKLARGRAHFWIRSKAEEDENGTKVTDGRTVQSVYYCRFKYKLRNSF